MPRPRPVHALPPITTDGDVAVLLKSWQRHLRARNLAAGSLRNYADAVSQLARFLAAQGMPLVVRGITREHLESFLISQRDRGLRGATIGQRYRGLHLWFGWLVEEGELGAHPMARMKPPRRDSPLKRVLTPAEIKRLLATCAGSSFEDRRDTALLYFLADTGARAEECVSVRLDDLDLEDRSVLIHGKGNKDRLVGLGVKTTQMLDRYLRVRARREQHRHLPELWLGVRGRLRVGSLEYLIKKRGEQADLKDLHPHLFRHYFVDRMLSADAAESDIMQLTGWSSRTQFQRYGAARANRRALEAHRQRSPGDDL